MTAPETAGLWEEGRRGRERRAHSANGWACSIDLSLTGRTMTDTSGSQDELPVRVCEQSDARSSRMGGGGLCWRGTLAALSCTHVQSLRLPRARESARGRVLDFEGPSLRAGDVAVHRRVGRRGVTPPPDHAPEVVEALARELWEAHATHHQQVIKLPAGALGPAGPFQPGSLARDRHDGFGVPAGQRLIATDGAG